MDDAPQTPEERRSNPAPEVPPPTTRLPVVWLWLVPILMVLVYVVLVAVFFHDQAHWTAGRILGVTVLLLSVTLLFSALWYGFAYGAALVLGELVPLGVMLLISRIPGIHRHGVVTPPTRADSRQEVWGRFAILLVVLLGFELIFMIVVVRRGALNPGLVLNRPFDFFLDEAVSGLLLAGLLAPVGALLASRLRTRITDSLEFPLLWLAGLLLVVGGVGVLTTEVLPGVIVSPALFLTSVLFYAPAAWFVALAFSRSESIVQDGFLRRAWKARSHRFHFGRIQVIDVPEGTATVV
jgi:hypothetical protein